MSYPDRLPTARQLPRFNPPPVSAQGRLPRVVSPEQQAFMGGSRPLPTQYTVNDEDVNSTPTGDERLSGEGGAELGARRLPRVNSVEDTAQASPIGSSPYQPASAPSELETAQARMAGLITSPVEDENGHLRSAAIMAAHNASEASKSGSLGYTLGAALGGAISGAINPKADEALNRSSELAKSQAALQIASEADKNKRERKSQEIIDDLHKAEAEKARRLPVVKPVYKKQGGVTYLMNPDGTTGTPIVGVKGEPLAPDFQRPVFVDTLADDGVTVTRNRYNPETNTYEPVTSKEGDAATVKRLPRVNVESGMTAAQEAADANSDADRAARLSEGRENRASHERIASENRASHERISARVLAQRDKIASVNQEIQRTRARLGESKMRAEYPGFGKKLTKDQIIQKFEQIKKTRPDLTLDMVVDSAVAQGYEVEQ